MTEYKAISVALSPVPSVLPGMSDDESLKTAVFRLEEQHSTRC